MAKKSISFLLAITDLPNIIVISFTLVCSRVKKHIKSDVKEQELFLKWNFMESSQIKMELATLIKISK
jgi:hypothetical protein